MKTINASWEKKNLGVSCTEIKLDTADAIDQVIQSVCQINDDYIVVKIPVPRVDLLLYFQSIGYSVIEVVMHIKMRLHTVTFPSLYKRYEKWLSFREATTDDVHRCIAETEAGIFSNDRISLDPHFSPVQAAKRYRHWIEDELGRNSKAFIATYKAEDIGFSILRDDGNGLFNGLFGALFKEKKNSALGFALGWANIIKAKDLGGTIIETTVSINNLAALKMNLSIGYETANAFYILVKHKNPHIN